MNDQMKLTSAVLAGYLLGRTKQGKRALRLALWFGGGSGGVASVVAQQARAGLAGNPAVAALLDQVRGPLADAGRKALTTAVEQRANALADSLHSRTESLALPGAEKVTETGKSGVKSAVKAGTKSSRKSARDDDQEPEDANQQDESRGHGRSDRKSTDGAQKTTRPTKKTSGTGRTTSTATQGTGRAKRTPESGTKRSGNTRSNTRSTTQGRQSSTGSRSRGGSQTASTRRRSGQ